MEYKNKLRKVILPTLLVGASMINSGCSGFMNDVKARGGVIGSYEGDYIAIKQSGGIITDVYKLRDVYMDSISNADGWRFQDQMGNMVFIDGDFKLIRIRENDDQTWSKYHEYHQEFESKTYQELYASSTNN